MGNPLSYAIGMPFLTVCGLVASLVIPRFLAPAEFGSYALLLDLCRYAMRTDLGLTQLADRRIAAGLDSNDADDEAKRLIAARWQFGMVAMAVLVPAAAAFSSVVHIITPIDAALATSTGIVAMIAGGPSTIYRARGDVWMYTSLTFVFAVGFVVPRLLGVALGGITGCFALLLVWYAAVAASFFQTYAAACQMEVNTRDLVRASLPMFIFAVAWTLYLSASRWMASILCPPAELGLFALSANLILTGVTTVGLIADVRYPQWLRRLSRGSAGEHAPALTREALFVALALALAVSCLVPFVPSLLNLCFPRYLDAAPSLAALACASVPLSVFAWFLPVMIARSTQPARDSAIVFGPAVLLLVGGMVMGQRFGGLEGQAWAGCASAVVALAGMAFVFQRAGVLCRRWALCFLAAPTVCLLLPATATVVHRSPASTYETHAVCSPRDACRSMTSHDAASGRAG